MVVIEAVVVAIPVLSGREKLTYNIMNYYIAKVFVRHCLADIRINDVPLLKQNVDADLTAEMPINHLIEHSGHQVLTLHVYPKLGELTLNSGAQCSVEIWRYDGSGPKIIPIEQVCSSSLAVGEADKTLPSKYDNKSFLADVSYQIQRWSDCEEITDSRKVASEVASLYQKIGKMLANKQYNQYLELLKNREQAICKALSLDEDEASLRNQMLFECLDEGFVLQPLKGGKQMHFYANKRIVTVLDDDLRSALRFQNEETGEVLAIELFLGIKKGQRSLSIV